jgi:hypothetical protein
MAILTVPAFIGACVNSTPKVTKPLEFRVQIIDLEGCCGDAIAHERILEGLDGGVFTRLQQQFRGNKRGRESFSLDKSGVGNLF